MVLRRSLLILVIVIAAVFLAYPAAAISLDVTSEEKDEAISIGGSLDFTVTVSGSSGDVMVCPGGGSITIDMTVEGEDSDTGFTGDISPTTVELSIASGAYGGALDGWEDSGTTTFTASINNNIRPGHLSHSYRVVATYGGGAPADCVMAQDWGEESSNTSVSVTSEAPAVDDDDAENGDDEDNDDSEAEEGPAPAVAVLILITAAIVSLRRRR